MIEITNHTMPKIFSLEEATELLPLVYRMTEDSSKDVKVLAHCLENLFDKNSDRAKELQGQIDDMVTRWHNKLERLGIKPKGLWLADFNNGTGYFCWKFPETKIMYCHGYHDGFTGRKLIQPRLVDEEFQNHESGISTN